MSDAMPDNCGGKATYKPEHCRGGTSGSGFPTVQASSGAQLPLNALKLPGANVCL